MRVAAGQEDGVGWAAHTQGVVVRGSGKDDVIERVRRTVEAEQVSSRAELDGHCRLERADVVAVGGAEVFQRPCAGACLLFGFPFAVARAVLVGHLPRILPFRVGLATATPLGAGWIWSVVSTRRPNVSENAALRGCVRMAMIVASDPLG